MLSIGSWNERATSHFHRLVNKKHSRKLFIQLALAFLKEKGFHGLHLNWNWPACWHEDCFQGTRCEKLNYKIFIVELHKAFKIHGLKLAVALPASTYFLKKGFDTFKLHEYVDFITVRTFSMVHPLYQKFDVDAALEQISKCCNPPIKIVIDIPIFTPNIVRDKNCIEINPRRKPQILQPISMNEICAKIAGGWQLNTSENAIQNYLACIKFRSNRDIEKEVTNFLFLYNYFLLYGLLIGF